MTPARQADALSVFVWTLAALGLLVIAVAAIGGSLSN